MITLCIIAALSLDRLLGELRRFHPLVGFGNMVTQVESWLYSPGANPSSQLVRGIFGWLLLTMPPVALCFGALSLLDGWLAFILNAIFLYFCIGYKSLREHARAILAPLILNQIEEARRQVSMIVSRDTHSMDRSAITRATIESVLENGNDALFASLFWFVVAGAPGALLHRLANTLDARWGYRSDRYLYFGKAAARMDDVLAWIPARLCALGYAFCGALSPGLRCWRQQAPRASSPNAGPVMAAGAGALAIELGGMVSYGGKEEVRPVLGCGGIAKPADINRALDLMLRTLVLWLITIGFLNLGELL